MTDKRSSATQSATAAKLPGITVLLLALAVLAQTGNISYHSHQDRKALESAIAGQEEAFRMSRKMRRQLNVIAGKTVQLAQQGNSNAAMIIEKMQAAGINFSQGENP